MKLNQKSSLETHIEATVSRREFSVQFSRRSKVVRAGSLAAPGLLTQAIPGGKGAGRVNLAPLAGPPGIREIRRVNSKRVTVASKWVSRDDL